MQKPYFFFPLLASLALVVMLGVSSWSSPGTIIPLQDATPSAIPVETLTPEEDSWIIVDLPPDATQLEYGAEVYRLVCKACHGDKGQGLTDDWRAQWNPRDQNCWQSKCHGGNHPPDGFYLPMSPAVVGPPLQMFDTALDLYNYIHTYMPWHDPASMTQKDSWSVTAYILKINNIDPGSDLNPNTASEIRLRSGSIPPVSPVPALATDAVPISSLQEEEVNRISPIWIAAISVAVVLIIFGIVTLIRRFNH